MYRCLRNFYEVNTIMELVEAQARHISRLYEQKWGNMTEVLNYLKPKIATKLDDPKLAPYRAHESDAGADLFTATSTVIAPGEQKMIDTGVAVKIPIGHVGLVFNRSSQGKLNVQIANGTGVIDSDYRGNIKVLLRNNSNIDYNIIKFETRIAQLVIMPVVLAVFENYTGDNWNDTVRGTGSFGSTG